MAITQKASRKPYLYKICKNKQCLYFFGEKHSFDPKKTQWVKLKSLWSDFLKDSEQTKKVTFVEAGKVPPATNETEAITEAGGTGLVSFLANQSGVEMICPEPSKKQESIHLEKRFPRERIEYYYFARVVDQWWKIPEPRPDFEKYISGFLDRDKRVLDWKDFDFSFENMKKIHRKLFKKDFNLNKQDFFRDISSPYGTNNLINKIVISSGNFREKHLTEKILEYWEKGYSIFIEYGSSHAIAQEVILKNKL